MAGYLGSEAAFVSVAIADIEGDLNVGVDATIEGNLTVSGLVPDVDATVDLGSPTKSFGDLYVNNIISPNMINNPNLLINPSFTVKQRGAVIDHNGTSYGPDRWQVRGLDVVGGTMSQSTTAIDPTTGTNKLVVKHRNAVNHAHTLQPIEAVNLQGLYGKEMTFSFSYSDTGGSGIPFVAIYSWGSTSTYNTILEAFPTSLGNNRWSCTFTLSTNDGTFPDLNEKGMEVYIYPNEQSTAPNEWSVWEPKLEAGSVATPFIARSYGEELALCQRYFYKHYKARANENIGNASMYNSVDTYVTYRWPVRMRTNPTVSISAASDFSITGNSSDFPATGFSAGHPSPFSVQLNFQRLTGLTNGYAYWIRMLNGDADNSKYIQAEAEL